MKNRNIITIVDYGVGNIGSIVNMINKMGGQSIVVNSPDELGIAKKIICQVLEVLILA